MKILAKIRAEILLRIGNLQRRSPAGAPHLSGQRNVVKWFDPNKAAPAAGPAKLIWVRLKIRSAKAIYHL